MTAKTKSTLATLISIAGLTVVVGGIIFAAGKWYQQSCSLEKTVSELSQSVKAVDGRVSGLEQTVRDIDRSVVEVSKKVDDIQEMLLLDKNNPLRRQNGKSSLALATKVVHSDNRGRDRGHDFNGGQTVAGAGSSSIVPESTCDL